MKKDWFDINVNLSMEDLEKGYKLLIKDLTEVLRWKGKGKRRR